MDPSSADAHASLATAYAFRANYLPDRARWVQLALDSATRATGLDPDSASAARALGVALVQAGRQREAAPSSLPISNQLEGLPSGYLSVTYSAGLSRP